MTGLPGPALKSTMSSNSDKEEIKSFFKTAGYSRLWDWTEWREKRREGSIIVAIEENDEWYRNCCILRDSYFDYEKCEAAGWFVDCLENGVYIFVKQSPKLISVG